MKLSTDNFEVSIHDSRKIVRDNNWRLLKSFPDNINDGTINKWIDGYIEGFNYGYNIGNRDSAEKIRSQLLNVLGLEKLKPSINS
jgi:hypothetical protein